MSEPNEQKQDCEAGGAGEQDPAAKIEQADGGSQAGVEGPESKDGGWVTERTWRLKRKRRD